MAYENCPLSIASPQAIAIAPTITYSELNTVVKQTAFSLKTLGFQPGDRIAIRSDPNWKTIALLFASWRIGAVAALLAPNLPLPETPIPFPTLSSNSFPDTKLDLEKTALMLRTSGSSGNPKWASFSLSQLFESARTVARALNGSPQNRWLVSIPLHHVGGLGVFLRGVLTEGILTFENKALPYPDRILSAQADFASLVPTQLYRLLREETPPLKTHILIGGAPLTKELYQKGISKALRLSLAYGLTEMSSTVLLTDTPRWIGSSAYLGMPLPNRTISLSADGEILVSGKSLFNGYGFPPNAPPSPFPTGDLGAFDPELGWSIQGRKDFQFLSGGENIQPEEIETAILSHPEVEEAIVVPKPDEEFGARPIAFVRSRLTAEDLTAHLSKLHPKWKIPIFFKELQSETGLKPSRIKLAEKFKNVESDPYFNGLRADITPK